MYDFLLTSEGDLDLSSRDLRITKNNVMQAACVVIRWFQNEYDYYPEFGIDWISLFSERASENVIVERISTALMGLEGVQSIKDMSIDYNALKRTLNVSFCIVANGEEYRGSVLVYG